jgi:hypothetical protein
MNRECVVGEEKKFCTLGVEKGIDARGIDSGWVCKAVGVRRIKHGKGDRRG